MTDLPDDGQAALEQKARDFLKNEDGRLGSTYQIMAAFATQAHAEEIARLKEELAALRPTHSCWGNCQRAEQAEATLAQVQAAASESARMLQVEVLAMREALAHYREGMLAFRARAYQFTPLPSLVTLDEKYLAKIEAEELAALVEPAPPTVCGYGQNLGHDGLCILLTGHSGAHKMSGKIRPLVDPASKKNK